MALAGDCGQGVRSSTSGTSIRVPGAVGDSGMTGAGSSRCTWRLRHTSAAASPTPWRVTNSRAIAVSKSSSSSMACKPSAWSFPSIAKETCSFFPISRRQLSCAVSEYVKKATRTRSFCPIRQLRRLAWRKV